MQYKIHNTQDIHSVSYLIKCPSCGEDIYIDFDDGIPGAQKGSDYCDLCKYEIEYEITGE